MGLSETTTLEREKKFEAPEGLALPDLNEVGELGGRIERIPPQHLRTAYFDTADGRLWDQGITLRHRITDDEGDGTWTLKLPQAVDGSTLERTEMSWSGERATVPWEVRVIMRGVIRREPLQEVVELDTTRLRLVLRDEKGDVVAEVDDDTVTVAGGPRDGLGFRQVELELPAGETTISREVTARLEEAGLAAENSPKFAKAMGFSTSPSTRPSTGRSSSLADVVRAGIVDGFGRLLDHDWRLRVALPDARDVHQARVAIRRLRSHLKTFSVVLDPVWVHHVRRDLKWAGSPLGELRDTDVLAVHLDGAPAPLSQELSRQRNAAARQVALLLASERYLDLLDRLHAAAGSPPFYASGDTVRADDPAIGALPELVGAPWRALRHQVRKGGTSRLTNSSTASGSPRGTSGSPPRRRSPSWGSRRDGRQPPPRRSRQFWASIMTPWPRRRGCESRSGGPRPRDRARPSPPRPGSTLAASRRNYDTANMVSRGAGLERGRR